MRALAAGAALLFACAAPALAGESGRADVVGSIGHHVITGEETMLDVARDDKLGFVELMAANPGVDPWLPGVGREVVVPAMHVLPDAPRRGIVINLTAMRLYLFSDRGDVVGTWPIGIGRDSDMTPLGATRVTKKELNPAWYPPESIREEKPELPAVVPAGPDNPLGDRALYLGWPSYLIHGTNKPFGVGRRVSHGCIRLYPEGITELYGKVPVGTPVTVVDQAVELGWRDGALYLQIHPSKTQADQIEAEGRFDPEPLPDLHDKVTAAAGDRAAEIDWRAVDRATVERSGIPVVVLGNGAAPSAAMSTADPTSEASAGGEPPIVPDAPAGDSQSIESNPPRLPPIH